MPLDRRAYRALLAATILASGMAFIDSTALNVALPAIQQALQLQANELLWVVNSYVLFLSALLLFGGSLGDTYGRKKVFSLGIALFTVASMLCGLASDATLLIVFRAVQGVGGALMIPGSLSLLSSLVSRERKGQAIGTWSMFSALTTIIGPAVGGLLAEAGLWRMIFFINVPLSALCLFFLIKFVPESRGTNNKTPDFPGIFLGTLSLGLITYGFTEASRRGFEAWPIRLAIAAGIVLFVLFLAAERRAKNPLLPTGIFASRLFSAGNIITFLVYSALGATLFFYPLNLIQIQGYSAATAGLTLLPFGLLIAVFSGISGKISDKTGPRTPLIFGGVLVTIALFLFSVPGITAGPPEFWSAYFPPLLLFGIGMGLIVAPLTTLVMNSAPDRFSGAASGINNTVARTAQVLAVAIIGSVAALTFQQEMETALKPALSAPDYALIEAEIAKMGDAQAPENLTDTQQKAFKTAKNAGFVLIFRMVTLLSCILTGISTLLTFLAVPRR